MEGGSNHRPTIRPALPEKINDNEKNFSVECMQKYDMTLCYMILSFILAKVKSSKKVKRTANGGIVMFKKKTIVGGDSIKIEGSKIVNITTGGSRRNRDKDESGRRRESDRENGQCS